MIGWRGPGVQTGMARLPRLTVSGLPHIVCQRVSHGQKMVVDELDRTAFLVLLGELAAQSQVAIHAYSVSETRFDLVLTPVETAGLSRFMQALARRYAVAFNARHGRRGGLWEGRFRSAVIDPETWLLPSMLAVEAGIAADSQRRWTSFPAHVGECTDRLLSPSNAYWRLGNTPFEREVSYRSISEQALTTTVREAIEAALRGGWPLGSAEFIKGLTAAVARPVRPRPRGRPRGRRYVPI